MLTQQKREFIVMKRNLTNNYKNEGEKLLMFEGDGRLVEMSDNALCLYCTTPLVLN